MVGVNRVGIRSLFIFVLSASFLLAIASRSLAATSVTIGHLLGDSAATAAATGEALSKANDLGRLIEKQTGLKVHNDLSVTTHELAQKISEKKIDFAFLSSLAMVEIEEKTKVKVLLKKVWDQGYYYSVWLTKKNSSVRRLRDLRGKRIAFVDTKSASGYLYPQQALRDAGFDLKKDLKSIVFSESHEKSVKLLRQGEVDAIAVFSNDKTAQDSAWTHHNGRAQEIRPLWTSEAIPNDPFVVRTDFYERSPKVAHDLMFGLIEMFEAAALSPDMKRLLDARGLMAATSLQYDPVRQMYRTLKISQDQKKDAP